MSSTKLRPLNDDDDDDSETVLISDRNITIRDVRPRSMLYDDDDDDDDCLYTCSFCPSLSSWCVKDALGIGCSIMTWVLFLYGQFIVPFVILTFKNYSFLFNSINLVLFHVLEFLSISSQLKAMFTDPGAIPLNSVTSQTLMNYENGSTVYRCVMCNCIKIERAHHCSVCKRCIKRMDHHCVFINNCVGENNQKYFILFTFYTFLLSAYGLVLAIFHVHRCVTSNWIACPSWSPPATMFFIIFAALEGLAFSIFTGFMTGSQLYAIYSDTTGIEYHQGRSNAYHDKKTFLSSLKTVFGSQVGLSWLNPFSKPIYLDVINSEYNTFH